MCFSFLALQTFVLQIFSVELDQEEPEIEYVEGYEELEEEEDMEDFSGFPSNGSGFDDDDELGKILFENH